MQVDQASTSAAAPTPAVTSKLDMALGDLTKRRRSNGAHRGRVNRQDRKKTTATTSKSTAASAAASLSAGSLDFGSKILVSNLHYGVTEADLKVSTIFIYHCCRRRRRVKCFRGFHQLRALVLYSLFC